MTAAASTVVTRSIGTKMRRRDPTPTTSPSTRGGSRDPRHRAHRVAHPADPLTVGPETGSPTMPATNTLLMAVVPRGASASGRATAGRGVSSRIRLG